MAMAYNSVGDRVGELERGVLYDILERMGESCKRVAVDGTGQEGRGSMVHHHVDTCARVGETELGHVSLCTWP